MRLVLMITWLLCSSWSAVADSGRGLEIMKELEIRDSGWGDTTADLEMLLTRRNGKQSIRRLHSKLLEVQGDGDRGLTVFLEPRDVKGTAFLNHSHALKPDDQWIYFPALRRTKRISSAKKTGRFMGSEFSYEDMSSLQIEKYEYHYLGDQNYAEQAVFMVQAISKDKHSGYSKQIMLIDQAFYRILKIDFYDTRDQLLKTMEMLGYQQFKGKYWRATSSKMTNHLTGRATELRWRNMQFGTGLKASDFAAAQLQRSR